MTEWIYFKDKKPVDDDNQVEFLISDLAGFSHIAEWYKDVSQFILNYIDYSVPIEAVWWSRITEPKKIRWQPKHGDLYYFIDEGKINSDIYDSQNNKSAILRRSFLGIYNNKPQAILLKNKIEKLVKEEIGDTEDEL